MTTLNQLNNQSENAESLFTNQIDPVCVQKMVFIYNALNDGWEVKKKSDNKYIFTRNQNELSEEIKKEINLDDYLRKFIQFNLNIDNLTNSRRTNSL